MGLRKAREPFLAPSIDSLSSFCDFELRLRLLREVRLKMSEKSFRSGHVPCTIRIAFSDARSTASFQHLGKGDDDMNSNTSAAPGVCINRDAQMGKCRLSLAKSDG